MLQPRNPYILRDVPHFCPGKNFFILTLHTLRQPLDWPLIPILTSQPIHKTYSGPRKQKSLNLDLWENRKSQNFSKGTFW